MGCGGSKKDVSDEAHKDKKHSEHKSEKESHSEKHPNQPNKDSSSENKAHPKPAEHKDETKKPKEEHEKDKKKEHKEEDHKKEHKEDHPKEHKEDHPKEHKEDHPKEHKEDHPKEHKEDHPKEHKADHPKEHKEDHPKEHKEDHPKEHKEDHPKEHKEDHPKEHKKEKHNDEHKEEHHGHKDHPAEPHADPAHSSESAKKPDQAGGHSGSLIARGDKLLKKAGPKEQAFYQYLFSEECQDPALVQLREIVPHFYGIEVIDGKNFMVLENLLTGFDNPNLLDCKIGKVTWTRDHNEAKLADQRKKAESTTTGSLGFRITGLVVKDHNGQTVESIMKDEGFSTIKQDNIHEYFNKIVNGNKEQVQTFIHQTERILNWFKSQTSKVFFTASLFYVNGKNGKSQTRFIDLAYVYNAEGQHDDSKSYLDVIQGLESVIEIWKRLL